MDQEDQENRVIRRVNLYRQSPFTVQQLAKINTKAKRKAKPNFILGRTVPRSFYAMTTYQEKLMKAIAKKKYVRIEKKVKKKDFQKDLKKAKERTAKKIKSKRIRDEADDFFDQEDMTTEQLNQFNRKKRKVFLN